MPSRFGMLALLSLLLAGSGCAALIYEVVWLQLVQLVIGSSAVSLAILLAAYMGGLCLGSVLLPRLLPPRHNPLRIYAILEAGVGIFGIVELFAVPLIGRLYLAGPTAGLLGLVLRGIVAAICLLPPTMLMGASLPAISRWVKTAPRLGLLYSANILGAVCGCFIAGFYLLRVYDMELASYAAAAINFAVAGLSLLVASRLSSTPATAEPSQRIAPRAALVYVVIALSGMSALGAEVVWTRLLSLLLGGTVYTFSIILGVFLVGLWAGSSLGSYLAGRLPDVRLGLTVCQLLLGVAIAWTSYTISHSLPFWPVDPWLSTDAAFNFEIDLVRCIWAVLPATLLWGASFPLALAAAADSRLDPGQLTGGIYAANTLGSIAGALVFSLILIPNFGTRASQFVLIAVTVGGTILAASGLASLPRRVSVCAASLALAAVLVMTITEVPWEMIAYGRRIAPTMRAIDLYKDYPSKVLFRGEGISSSVVITERAGQRHFYVSGKAEASTAPLDMRLERMMGHLPALIHSGPRTVLIVGFGAGVTAGSFVTYPEVRQIVICELEPFIPPASTRFFGPENYQVMQDPRTRIAYDDARHYIFTTGNKFDVITTDPIHPWIKGTSTLYSRQYYELVRAHLKPGGVVAQWLPIYDSDAETVKIELATFFSVFPNGTIWTNAVNGDGYDLVLLGRPDDQPINVDQLQDRLNRPDYAKVTGSLSDVGLHSAVEIAATYAGDAAHLRPLTENVAINDDINMRLQYKAGLGLNSMAFPQIYKEILSYRRFPDALTGAAWRLEAIKTLLRSRR